MSIKAMNWAWSIPLPPTLHIVLLALSDILRMTSDSAFPVSVRWPGCV